MAEPTLYERLGGIFAIAAVVDNFSDRLLKNPEIVQANPQLTEWHTVTYPGRFAGPQVAKNLVGKLSFPAGISPVESTWVACYDWCLT